MEKKSPDLVIVYDKYTETAANGFSGGLVDYKYTCLVQKDTVFESKKNSYTNNNKILFLSENLINQYMSMSHESDYVIDIDWGDTGWGKRKFKIYFYLYSLGNWRGIWVDIEKSAKSQPRKYRNAWYLFRYFGDYYAYPIVWNKISKWFDSNCYEEVIKFFLKEENIKLILSD